MCVANQMIIHFTVFAASIIPSVRSVIQFFSSNHPGAKFVVLDGIEGIPSTKEQRQPLPSLLFVCKILPYCIGKEHYIRVSSSQIGHFSWSSCLCHPI